jgi:hypothetical protein
MGRDGSAKWAARVAKYGPTGLSLEGREAMREALRQRHLARTHCKYGHPFALYAKWYQSLNGGRGARLCVRCRREKKRAKSKSRQLMTTIVTKGMSIPKIAARIAWQTRRERYGPAGNPPETVLKMAATKKAQIAREGHHMSRRTHCKWGHPLSGDNVKIYRNKRICRTCEKAARARAKPVSARPEWVERDGVGIHVQSHDLFYLQRLRVLRVAMIEAHPDKGRRKVSTAFIAARRALDVFSAQEAEWYAVLNLDPPTPPSAYEAEERHARLVARSLKAWDTRRQRAALRVAEPEG